MVPARDLGMVQHGESAKLLTVVTTTMSNQINVVRTAKLARAGAVWPELNSGMEVTMGLVQFASTGRNKAVGQVVPMPAVHKHVRPTELHLVFVRFVSRVRLMHAGRQIWISVPKLVRPTEAFGGPAKLVVCLAAPKLVYFRMSGEWESNNAIQPDQHIVTVFQHAHRQARKFVSHQVAAPDRKFAALMALDTGLVRQVAARGLGQLALVDTNSVIMRALIMAFVAPVNLATPWRVARVSQRLRTDNVLVLLTT